MRNKIYLLILSVFLISLISATDPICLDTNSQDISDIPCLGFTVSLNCTQNVSAFNATDASINFSFPTNLFTGSIYNFTLNLSAGEYELVDCANNSATIFIGRVDQGYGINMFGIIFPSILLTVISLFVSGKLFNKFHDDDDEEHEKLEEENDQESFIPRSRLMPLIFMLFAFIPMIFMVGFVNNHLEEYLSSSNMTTIYGSFYILFSGVFYFIFLLSFVVWIAGFIKKRRVMRGLDEIE